MAIPYKGIGQMQFSELKKMGVNSDWCGISAKGEHPETSLSTMANVLIRSRHWGTLHLQIRNVLVLIMSDRNDLPYPFRPQSPAAALRLPAR